MSLELMDLSIDDFTWYNIGSVSDFMERGLPQLVNELTVSGSALTVVAVGPNIATGYDEIKIAFVFNGQFLPVYETGEFYIKPSGSYATRKHSEGYALLGVRNAS